APIVVQGAMRAGIEDIDSRAEQAATAVPAQRNGFVVDGLPLQWCALHQVQLRRALAGIEQALARSRPGQPCVMEHDEESAGEALGRAILPGPARGLDLAGDVRITGADVGTADPADVIEDALRTPCSQSPEQA